MYKFLLCLRYLRTRYIALASIISVMLGVATMIVVNSVMTGFSTEMRDRIHGLLADVVVETANMDGIPDADAQMQRIQDVAGDRIEAMTPTVEVFGLMSFNFAGGFVNLPVTIIGIDPVGKSKVGPLVEYLDSYKELRENGELLRPPLRDKSELPSWELTSEGKAYRAMMKERQAFFMNEDQAGPAQLPSQLADTGRAQKSASADANTEQSAVRQAVATVPTMEEAAQANVTQASATKSTDSAEPEFETDATDGVTFEEDPFDSDPFPSRDQKTNDEPFSARLYVGKGLISYPIEDPDTGETEIKDMVRPGDDVILTTYSAGQPPDACKFNATIVDTFRSGMSEYDQNLVFMNLAELQDSRGMFEQFFNDEGEVAGKIRAITSVQIKLKDYRDARSVVADLQAAFPPGVIHVRTWEDKQGVLLEAVAVESAILNVLLFLIIAVAGFGILAIFFMIVVEKTRDIGILKALGASSSGISSIFLSYGLALGIVGSGVGVVIGLLFVRYINEIEDGISWITGHRVFDEKIYYFQQIPTQVNAGMVIWVACGAIAIAVLASVLPARRAARLKPVEALRFE